MLSKTYKQQHPVCEECLKHSRITPSIDIHHIKSPFSTGEINYTLLYDPDNLMALCKECHQKFHNKKQENDPMIIINALDELMAEIED